MGRVVTALVPRAGRREQEVDLFIDGQFCARLLSLTAAQLAQGQELSQEQVEALLQDDEANRAQERALRLLEHRPRSRAELEKRLRQAGFAPAAIAKALERLARVGLVDDHAFARYWVEQRLAFRPRSTRALRYELRAQGVNPEAIAAALQSVDDTRAALELARAQRRREAEDESAYRRRLAALLRRRGFSYGTVRAVLEAISKDEE
jgi:regulatory protein